MIRKDMSDKNKDNKYDKSNHSNQLLNLSIQEKIFLKRQGVSMNTLHDLQHNTKKVEPSMLGSNQVYLLNQNPDCQVQGVNIHQTPQPAPQKQLNLQNIKYQQFSDAKYNQRHISVPKNAIVFHNSNQSNINNPPNPKNQKQVVTSHQGSFQIKKTQNVGTSQFLPNTHASLINNNTDTNFSPLVLHQNHHKHQQQLNINMQTQPQMVPATLQAKGQLKKVNRIYIKQTTMQNPVQVSMGPNLSINCATSKNEAAALSEASRLANQTNTSNNNNGLQSNKLPLKQLQIGKNQGNFRHKNNSIRPEPQITGLTAAMGLAAGLQVSASQFVAQNDQQIVPSEFISANGLNLPMIQMNNQQIQHLSLTNNQKNQNISERAYNVQQQANTQVYQGIIPKQPQSANSNKKVQNAINQNNVQFQNQHQILIPTTNLIQQHKISQQQLHQSSTQIIGSQPQADLQSRQLNSNLITQQLSVQNQINQSKGGILNTLLSTNRQNFSILGTQNPSELQQLQNLQNFQKSKQQQQRSVESSSIQKSQKESIMLGAVGKSSSTCQQRNQPHLYSNQSHMNFRQKHQMLEQNSMPIQVQGAPHFSNLEHNMRVISNQSQQVPHQIFNSLHSTPDPGQSNSRLRQHHSHLEQYRFQIQGVHAPVTLKALQDLPLHVIEQLIKNKKLIQIESAPFVPQKGMSGLGMSQQNYTASQFDLAGQAMSSGEYGQAPLPYQPIQTQQLAIQQKKQATDLYGNPITKTKQKIPFENAYVEDCYKFIICPGNNSTLVRRLLEKRSWWIEIQAVHSLYNFKWQPVSRGIRFDRLAQKGPTSGIWAGGTSTMGGSLSNAIGHGGQAPKHGNTGSILHKSSKAQHIDNNSNSTASKTLTANYQISESTNATSQNGHSSSLTISDLSSRQIVNHLEYHHLITEKYNLLISLTKFCDLQKENVFDITPITFFVEMPDVNKETAYNAAMQPFIQYFHALEDNKKVINDVKKELDAYKQRKHELDNDPDNIENGENSQEEGHDQTLIDRDIVVQSDADEKNEDKDDPNGSFDEINPDGKKEDKDKKVKESTKEPKGLLNNIQGYSTLYKTPGKDNYQKSTKFKQFNFEKRSFTKFTCPLSHFDGYNLWLLKPTHLNRGRGIHVFKDLPTLHKHIREYCIGKDEESFKKKCKQGQEEPQVGATAQPPGSSMARDARGEPATDESPTVHPESPDQNPNISSPDQRHKKFSPTKTQQKGSNSTAPKMKHNTFVIQKYIERPLLICNRKFDIRVWVLFDQDHNLHFFKEGYIRTSGSEFTIDLENVDNAAVHLTNNAVQKQLDSYGQFEDGNQLSYKRLQELLDLEQPDCGVDIYRDIVPAMKECIIKSIYSVRKTMDPYRRQYSFELFGYDFILDENFNTWLIEVNTNPCLEESSQLLRDVLPRMMEDMFQLTIDKIFPKNFLKKKRIHKDVTVNSPVKIKNRKSSALAGAAQFDGPKSLQRSRQSFSSKGRKTKKSSNPQKTHDDDGQEDKEPNADTQDEKEDQAQHSDQVKMEHGGDHDAENAEHTDPVTGDEIDAKDIGSDIPIEASSPKAAHGAAEVYQNAAEPSIRDLHRQAHNVAPRHDPTAIQEEALEETQGEIADEQDTEEIDRARKANKRIYSVQGYSDHENMWEKLLNVEKCEKCPATKHPNQRHEYTIVVQDRIFRIKKNPYYQTYLKKNAAHQKSDVFGETSRLENTFKDMPTSHRNLNQSPQLSPKNNFEKVIGLAQDVIQKSQEKNNSSGRNKNSNLSKSHADMGEALANVNKSIKK